MSSLQCTICIRQFLDANDDYRYCASINYLVDQYGGQAHWAKIELPETGDMAVNGKVYAKAVVTNYEEELAVMRNRLMRKYPIDSFNEYRKVLDPENVLANQLIDELFVTSNDNNDKT